METIRSIIRQGIPLICVSILVIAGGAELAWGDAGFTGVGSFDQGFTVNPGMSAYDPRTLIVNFGEPSEVKYMKPSGEQAFDFNALLDAPVAIEPDTAEPAPVKFEEFSESHEEQPAAIPESSSFLLLGLGLVLIIGKLWRKNYRNQV